MNMTIGSQFEMSLRILLLLEALSAMPLSESGITAVDFISVYSHDFGITDQNLHGNNTYRFGEFAYRRATVKLAIKQLVLDGLISALKSANGFQYKLTERGRDFIFGLDSDYADTYYETAIKVAEQLGTDGETLNEIINLQAVDTVRRD